MPYKLRHFFIMNRFVQTGCISLFWFSSEENECRSNRSKCEQLCVNTISGYYCECKKGYQLNGKYSCKGRLFGNYYYHLSEQNTAIIRVKRDLDPRRRSPLSALLNVGGGREGG